jgi:hypothetical protein
MPQRRKKSFASSVTPQHQSISLVLLTDGDSAVARACETAVRLHSLPFSDVRGALDQLGN